MTTVLSHALPKFYASFAININGSTKETYTHEGDVPEELMSAYAKVIGDGNAKVTISCDVSMKDYGSGSSSMAAVTLTCGQTEAQIREAQELAKGLAMEFAYKNSLAAKDMYKGLLQQSTGSLPGKPKY